MQPDRSASSFRFQQIGRETDDGKVRAYGENDSGASGGHLMGAAQDRQALLLLPSVLWSAVSLKESDSTGALTALENL